MTQVTDATASPTSSTINLVKTIVGAGMLAIPFVFRNGGVLVGVLLTVLAALASALGLVLLAQCSKVLVYPRRSSFFSLCMLAFPMCSPLSDLAMFVQCFGVGLSYLILVGDLFPPLFANFGDRNDWILYSTVIIVPLCMLKKLDNLKYSSIVGLFAMTYLVMLVIASYFNTTQGNRGDVNWISIYDLRGTMSSFSIIIFAFTGAMNLFSIVNELKNNSMATITQVINHSISLSSIVFLLIGVFGYLTFGSNTSGNIMLNYDSDFLPVKIGNFSLGTMVILTFPLLFHPLRIAINNIYVWCEIQLTKERTTQNDASSPLTPIVLQMDASEDTDDEAQSLLQNHNVSITPENSGEETGNSTPLTQTHHHAPFPDHRFYIISIILLVVMYILALSVRSFALVLSVVGATGSTSISFILPGILGYLLIGRELLATGRVVTPQEVFYKRAGALLAIFGVAVMILSLWTTLVGEIHI